MNRLISMRFPEGKAKAFTLSYDDGVEQDVRLIEIFDKHGLKATFNLNGDCYSPPETVFAPGTIHRRLSKASAIKAYHLPHEVATHSFTHPFLERLDSGVVCYEIIKDRESLEEDFATIVRGHAYPYGTYSDSVVECLRACGIVYARTVNSTHSFAIPQDWLRLDPTCHHNDPRVLELVQDFVKMTPKEPKLFYLWGHSYEFEADNNWEHIEDICRKISGKDDIWYATNIEVYEYVKAFESLIFSADMRYVKNPSATTLYFTFNEKAFVIEGGATIKLA